MLRLGALVASLTVLTLVAVGVVVAVLQRNDPADETPSGESSGYAVIGRGRDVWVTAEGTVRRLDEAGKVVVSAKVPDAGALAVDGATLWVDSGGAIVSLDATTLRRKPITLEAPGGPHALAVSPRAVLVLDRLGVNLAAYDSRTGQLRWRRQACQSNAGDVASDAGGGVWVTCIGPLSQRNIAAPLTAIRRGTLERISVTSGAPLGAPALVGRYPRRIVVGDGFLWILNTQSQSVSRIEADSQRLNRPVNIAVASPPREGIYRCGGLFLVGGDEGRLTRLQAAGRSWSEQPVPVGGRVVDVSSAATGVAALTAPNAAVELVPNVVACQP